MRRQYLNRQSDYAREIHQKQQHQRLAAFVRRQTNARSLSPQEGDDADAVLSRAEAALRDGDLGAALAELEALPDAAKPALSDWISAAEERRDAVSAVESLTNTVN